MDWTTVEVMVIVVVAFAFGLLLGSRAENARNMLLSPKLDRGLLLAISHLLEDAESGLNSLEGMAGHWHGDHDLFAQVKGKITLAQPMVRNLLGVEQAIGRGLGYRDVLDFPGADRHSL